MFNYIMPTGFEDHEQRLIQYVRQRAKLDRQFDMMRGVEGEIAQFADSLITRLVRNDAEMDTMRHEIERLNLLVTSCQRDIQELQKVLGMELGVKHD